MSEITHFKNAFITGASGGIGAALARLLAAGGTRVVLAARRETELRTVAEAIRGTGGQADVCALDVADARAVQDAMKRWDEETGGLDLVVANAGIGIMKPAHKLGWDDVEPVLRVNVVGAFATLMAAIPLLLERGHGTLAGVSSLASMRGLPAGGAYPASKAALATFLETLRLDLKPRGIQVVDVRPGFVDTDMTRKNKNKMPFLMNAEDAAKAALRGIERAQAVVAFPWPMAKAMSLAEAVPDAVYRGLAGRSKRGR